MNAKGMINMNLKKKKKLIRVVAAAVTVSSVMSSNIALAVDKKIATEMSIADYTATVTELEPIPHNIIKRANDELLKGETVIVQEGCDGVQELAYSVSYIGGVECDRREISRTVISEPVDKIVEYGTAEEENSDKEFEYKYVIECTATAYDPSPEENGGYGGQSATGIPLQKGVIAVDPNVIPLGSRVYIEALDGSWTYGYAVAGDTGGAIKGNRVDLLYPTKSECYQFGRRKCRVYVL